MDGVTLQRRHVGDGRPGTGESGEGGDFTADAPSPPSSDFDFGPRGPLPTPRAVDASSGADLSQITRRTVS